MSLNNINSKKINLLGIHLNFSFPKSAKIPDDNLNHCFDYISKNYHIPKELVLIQDNYFGYTELFFSQHLKKRVISLNPSSELTKIQLKNLEQSKDNKIEIKNTVLDVTADSFDIYYMNKNNYKFALQVDESGSLESFDINKVRDILGVIFISEDHLNKVDDVLTMIDERTKFDDLLIILKDSVKISFDKFKSIKIIDHVFGFKFLSKQKKEFFKKPVLALQNNNLDELSNKIEDLIKPIHNSNRDLNQLSSKMDALIKEVSEIKTGTNIQLNFVSLISDLRPKLQSYELSDINHKVDLLVNMYEKEIFALNKLVNKRNSKIEALLNSQTWKYASNVRKIIGKDAPNYQDYIKKHPQESTIDTQHINKIRSELIDLTRKQSDLNYQLKQAIEFTPQSSAILNHSSKLIKSETNLLEGDFGRDAVQVKERYNTNKFDDSSSATFAGLAAIPSRESALNRVVNSLISQVDKIGVYLNGWEKVPDFLNHPKVVVARSQEHGDLGDAGKFFWIDEHDGYYFSCDDDLVYPSDYVTRIIGKIKEYGYKAVVGWHGSVVSDFFSDYYNPKDRRVFSYSAGRPFDLDVHILGTGVLGFHTSTIDVKLADFERPNMADIFFARLGQQQKVRFVVMEHKQNEIETIEEFQEDSINKHGQKNKGSVKDVRKYKNDVATALDWNLNLSQPLNIMLIGRFENFKKGGIHKSNVLIQENLERLGHNVYICDSQSENFYLPDIKLDVAVIYPGDPNRPDYPEAMRKMEVLRLENVPILLNMSYNTNPKRSQFIVEEINKLNAQKGKSKVCLMVFTEAAKFDLHLQKIQRYVVPFPKTINVSFEGSLVPSFHDREGIFFGDATKLNNFDITNGNIINWVSEVRKRMPKTNFYVIKHYSGEFKLPNFEFASYMNSPELMSWIGNRRLSVCLNQFTTYEMVPVESQVSGTPVVYRSMPQSLNESLGLTGIPVSEPAMFGEMCQWLYNDETAWQEYNRLSLLNFERNHIDNSRIGLETAIRMVKLVNEM